MGGMSGNTQALFLTLLIAVERWSDKVGHRMAYVRGSPCRKHIAEQLSRYRRLLGRKGLIRKLRDDVIGKVVTTF